MKLIIIESPNKAKTIQKYLGQDYRVVASGGHVCDLPERSLGIDVEHDFKPEYVINKDKKDTIKHLKESVAKAETVYLATDPDREGEAISWHLANVLGLNKDSNRIQFNEISQKAVKKALANPREINMRLVDAQQARRVLDRLVGYKISPILNKKIKSGLSGGRVQSAALKMLVDREREIRDFTPEEYWNIFAFLTKAEGGKVFRAQFQDAELKKVKVSDKETADKVLALLNSATYTVDKVQRGVSKTRPQPPFTTSTLQQDGSHKLGLTAPQVMQVAQQLYEGIEMAGEGHVALVTYIRTDSVRISPDSQKDALEFIKSQYGADYIPEKPNFYATKSANVQDAHEAIRPISLDRTPESIKDKVNRNQYRLYKLIYNRFLASQMTDAVYNTLNVHITAETETDRKLGFKLSGKTLLFKGFTAVYELPEEGDDEKEGSVAAVLPDFTEGEKLLLKELKSEQKFTKPPSRYTDATLVKAMEESGIGRPSTYASVIGVLAKREYTVKEQKAIKPTNLGETVTDFMTEFFKNIVDLKFTANMESDLDTVENGGVRWQDIIGSFYPTFDRLCKDALFNNVKMKVKDEITDIKCEKCGSPMVIREGKYGKFLGCSNYPNCKNIKNLEEEVVSTCPDCGGKISKKHSKSGKVFYGCSNYPNCTFMSWEIPAPYYCPKCGKLMRIVKKGDKTEYICVNKTCNNMILVGDAGENKDED